MPTPEPDFKGGATIAFAAQLSVECNPELTMATTEGKKPAASRSPKTATGKSGTKSSTTKSASAAKAQLKPNKPGTPVETAAKRKAKPVDAGTEKSSAADTQARDTSMTSKEHSEHIDRIWELAKRIGTAMFVTWDGERQRARPLAAHVEKDEGAIYFLTDVHGEKDDQIAEFPYVSVNFADHKHSKFVALTGKASVTNDRARIKQLWSLFAKAWWDSPDDPAIRVIRLVPDDAELWDSPGRIVTTISMLAAAVTGRSSKIGENAKVTL
jgi:general stress protein 26